MLAKNDSRRKLLLLCPFLLTRSLLHVEVDSDTDDASETSKVVASTSSAPGQATPKHPSKDTAVITASARKEGKKKGFLTSP
jgi:hypothetical protein